MRGKVNNQTVRVGLYQDHPRLCGEKAGTQSGQYRVVGSPPPMRGKDDYSFRESS